ncbi:hypothetical protein [Vibrio lentus]|uniref:hypothetical protein n=1 Tax=Vibrio lentus TaxID=136468 RepID=UPI00178CD711|nr:hypothetical protein [Vibrio lentus]MDN3632520.1 hypothetical protein [Vibrio lentus]
MMEVYQALIIAAVTGGISSVATVAAIKVDITWIKEKQREHSQRIIKLESISTKLHL